MDEEMAKRENTNKSDFPNAKSRDSIIAFDIDKNKTPSINNENSPFSVVTDNVHNHSDYNGGSCDTAEDESSTSGDETDDESEIEYELDKEMLERYKVADIHFAFHNAKLVKLLFERGEAIKDIDVERR
jgi:hypothetical protein